MSDKNTQLEEELHSANERLRITMQTVAGCGTRGQDYVNAEVKKINEIRKKLNMSEIKAPKVADDGSLGFSTGIDVFSSYYKRN